MKKFTGTMSVHPPCTTVKIQLNFFSTHHCPYKFFGTKIYYLKKSDKII